MEKTNYKKSEVEEKTPISKKKIIVGVILICFAFFGSFIIYFVMQVALNTQYPMVVVVSGSMEPNINKGDLLFLQGKNVEDIKSGTIEDQTGDVIVYDARGLWAGAPSEPIVHRVVNKYEVNDTWYFETKGDANLYKDRAPVPGDHVLGVVVGRIPFIGWIKIFLTETNIFLPLIIILAALLIISIVYDIIKGEEGEDEQKEIKLKKPKKTLKKAREEYIEKIEVKQVRIKQQPIEELESSKLEDNEDQEDDFDF